MSLSSRLIKLENIGLDTHWGQQLRIYIRHGNCAFVIYPISIFGNRIAARSEHIGDKKIFQQEMVLLYSSTEAKSS